MTALNRTLCLVVFTALGALASSCAHSTAHGDAGSGNVDGNVDGSSNIDGSRPSDTVCGPAGMHCCAGNTCELGLRCSSGTCCVQAHSPTRCTSAADCCQGLTCTAQTCCAGRSSTCTGSADCCSGLVCSMGVCMSPSMGDPVGMSGCGAPGAVCCTGFTCLSGHVCNATTGHCEGCGTAGMRCCDGATACADTSLVCNARTGNCETAPDPTMRCGRIDGPCCAADGVSPGGTNCEGGLVCTAGTCSNSHDTGGPGQPCNPRGGCAMGNICNHTMNTCMPMPDNCGADMMMCCDTGGGTMGCGGSEHCQFGMCSSCVGPSLSCLLGGILPGQTCCNGSVCRPAPLVPRCCVGQGQMCTNSLDCCGLMQCSGGMCQAGRMGSLCIDSSECGMGLVCHLFMCQPDPMAMCAPQGQMCTGAAGCCTGYTCGVSHSATMTTAPTVCCTAHGGSCANEDECCGHMPCTNNMCACLDIDMPCFRDPECCDSGTNMATGATGALGCVAGACQITDHCKRPGMANVNCTGRADCCQGLDCLIGHSGGTQTVCCQEGMSPCQHDADCCGTMTCTMGRCTCQAVGRRCSNDIDCCGAATCQAGTCA